MSFPTTPIPDQEYTHSNGVTYIYSDPKKAWEIKYEQATNTASLPLVAPSARYLPTTGASLPDSGGLLTQSDYNQWAFNSLVKVDETSRVDAGEAAPGDPDTNQLWYKPSTGSLYVYYNDGSSTQWVEIGSGGGVDLDGYATEQYVDDAIGAIPPSNTYTIETDPASGFPQIQLVDQDDNFSNVHFTATGELSVSSNANGITYGVNLSPYATKVYSDAGDLFLQNQLDNLEIEKGTVATYDCVDTQLGLTNARSGECIFSDTTASAVIILGFGTVDKNGNLTHPIAIGDIIEVIAPGGTVSRYTCNDNASAPAMVAVTFVSGDQTFSTSTEYSVYIYPQNTTGVSKDYVDSQDSLKLDLTGGTLTGNVILDTGAGLYAKEIIKTTRNTGYAFQVKPDDTGDATAFIHTNGNAEFANLTIEGVAQFASAKNSNAPVAGADLTNKSFTDSTYVKKYDRPGLTFGYDSGSSGDIPTGKFRWYIDNGRRMKISATTKHGIPWGVDTPNVDINFAEGHMFTIWTTVANSDNWRIKQTGTLNRIDHHANDILCYVSYHAENGSFSTSAEYNITIAGLF